MGFKIKFKIVANVVFWFILVFLSLNYELISYLMQQGKGQLSILMSTQSLDKFQAQSKLSEQEFENLHLISQIKSYSEDSLGFKKTNNYETIYDQKSSAILWVLSASSKYKIEPYYWHFPLLGKVSYKGYFERNEAVKEKLHLVSLGYDVDLRTVSAWSTLGWFKDPILTSMLSKRKGNLCNLIFHELFHSTYYASNSVEYNENLASFIAHKSTLNYLRTDSANLKKYLIEFEENIRLQHFFKKELNKLNELYDGMDGFSNRKKLILKSKQLYLISKGLKQLQLQDTLKETRLITQIFSGKNAWFVDYNQYNRLQDSLEFVFNKNYKSDIRKMVQSLKYR